MLDIQNITKTFNCGTSNAVTALNNLSLKISSGEFVVIVGTNGSGKSTVQNIIAGTQKADSGEIFIKNINVTDWPENKRAKLVSRIFKNPFMGTAPNMTIAENFAIASQRGKTRGFSFALGHRIKNQIKDKLEKLHMGLEDRLDTKVKLLSGGQRQAVTLLMASWVTPELFLLDEHTAALDPKSAEKVIMLTKEIVESNKLTTVMATHSMQQAANLGDRLIMLNKGKVVKDISGEAKKMLCAEDILEMFEEIRYVEMLDESAAEMLQENYF
jgi:putative ABC transport system ATP-binding protein